MSDELLRYYNSELAFLRRMGNEFALAHPGVAGNLKIGAEGEYDPYVGRMIEAFAYLTARIRHKIDDDYPEIAASMMDLLYPHYIRPIPSAAILEMKLDRGQADLSAGLLLPRHSTVETEPVEGEPCRFRTAYETRIWPVEVGSVLMRGQPFQAPRLRISNDARCALKIELKTLSREVGFEKLDIETLRFYIKAPPPYSYHLYETILNETIGLCFARDSRDDKAVLLDPAKHIKAVGFEADQGLYEYPAQSFLGYRLLTEFFCFPEKYLFFDVHVGKQLASFKQPTAELYLYFSSEREPLHAQVTTDTFRLGCTPIVNLFKQRAEPIRLTHFDAEYQVVPNARRPRSSEVYSIDRVVGIQEAEKEMEFHPFYSFRHASQTKKVKAYWHASRRQVPSAEGAIDQGTEMHISFVDLDFRPPSPGRWTIDIETTCLNRDIPAQLPFGGGQPKMYLESSSIVSQINCLTPPTRTIRPQLGQGARWRLVSHLALNQLSLSSDANGLSALKEILKLYDFKRSEETSKMIQGLTKITSKPTIGRLADAVPAGMCRGTQVTLNFNPDEYSGIGMFLFASVLERFLALYCQINSFVQVTARSEKQEGVIRAWKPRSGDRMLL
jgi:type VI secretion system protein ImpG